MVTLQEYLNREYQNKEDKERVKDLSATHRGGVDTNGKADLREFINVEIVDIQGRFLTDIDLSSCANLRKLFCNGNNLTSIDFLNTIPNPKKLEWLFIFNNNIQPTDIAVFSRFINLRFLAIGSSSSKWIKENKYNRFYGSLKSWKNLTKLEKICIEMTDVDTGLEYLPESLVKKVKGKADVGLNGTLECSSRDTSAKCKSIYDELEPFNFNLKSWQEANPEKMARVREEVFNVPSEIHWGKGNKEVIEKSTQIEISVADKQTQTEELSEEKELERLRAENEKLKTEHKGLNERVTRLEKQVEKIEAFNSQIEVSPK